jgi:hypothetical protein
MFDYLELVEQLVQQQQGSAGVYAGSVAFTPGVFAGSGTFTPGVFDGSGTSTAGVYNSGSGAFHLYRVF